MSFLKPYETSAGRLVKTDTMEKEVLNYITTSREDVSYEFAMPGCKFVFITGKNEEEKKLPVWDQPLFFKDIRGNETVALDIRPFVSLKGTEVINISDIARDKHNINFLILTSALAVSLKDSLDEIRPIVNNAMSAFAYLITNALSRITILQPLYKISIEIAAGIYFYTLLTDNDLNNDTERVFNHLLGSKLVSLLTKNELRNSVTNILKLGYDKNLNGLPLLENLLKAALPEDMHAIINVQAICKVLENNWYGVGGSKTTFISLESPATFIAMIHAVSSSTMFKSSKLYVTVDLNKKIVQPDHIVSFLNLTYTKRNNISLIK